MRHFELTSRGNLLFTGALCLVVGVSFLIMGGLWALGLLTVNHKVRPDTQGDWLLVLTGLAAGVAGTLIGWRQIGQTTFAVDLAPDGAVDLIRILGRTTTSVSQITEVGEITLAVELEDADAGRVRLSHDAGTTALPRGPATDELLAEIQRRNPLIVRRDRSGRVVR